MSVEPPEDRGRDRVLRGARQLFAAGGFHQSPISELASIAGVSVGQIYRLFAGKSDIIAAIIHQDFHLRLGEIEQVCAAVESGTAGIEESLRDLLTQVMGPGEDALSFEILAEAHRNPSIAATISEFCDHYRAGLRRLACAANPRLSDESLGAAEELMLACIFGLGHRSLSRPRLSAEATAAHVSGMIVAALRL